MTKFIVVHGPNLNLLGEREPEIYGTLTLRELNHSIEKFAHEMHVEVKALQSNHEGALIDFIHENRTWAEGIIINPGALTHYSYALRDAISSVNLPTIEVHLSNIYQRDEFRRHSVIKDICVKQIVGLKQQGYFRAVEYLVGIKVLAELKKYISFENNLDQCLKNLVQLLKQNYPKYTWVGIYLVEGNELTLHNYLGRPTSLTSIPIGQGICGAAVLEKRAIIVPDVNADTRYLACSVETRSEIVVPMMAKDSVLGEIDIDSDFKDIFHEGDVEILEQCAAVVAGKMSSNIED